MTTIKLLLAYAEPQQQCEVVAVAPSGTTLQQALALFATQIAALCNGESIGVTGAIGVWGKVRPSHYVLRDGDRVEFYRPLKADPKQARRARVAQQVKRDT